MRSKGPATWTAIFSHCHPPHLSSARREFGILLDSGATNSSGPNQKTKFHHVQRSMLFYRNLGLIYSWLAFFSYKSDASFCLKNTCCKYIYVHSHTIYGMTGALKLGWATRSSMCAHNDCHSRLEKSGKCGDTHIVWLELLRFEWLHSSPTFDVSYE